MAAAGGAPPPPGSPPLEAPLDRRVLPLHGDAVERCPAGGGLAGVVAVGMYQLDPAAGTRLGRVHLYRVAEAPAPATEALGAQGRAGAEAAPLAPAARLEDLAGTETPGVFDMKWQDGAGAGLLGLAGADGTARLYRAAAAGASLEQVGERAGAGEGGFCLSCDWGHTDGARDTLAISSSNGYVSVLRVAGGGFARVAAWEAHRREAWIVARDYHAPDLVYTGADDCLFKCWDLRDITRPAFSQAKTHGAGVTCAQSCPHVPCVVCTGSYDEGVRLWDVRNLGAPVLAGEAPTGGGVWRVKWHPAEAGLVITANMHAGFSVLRLDLREGCVTEVEKARAYLGPHGAAETPLGYGVDWTDAVGAAGRRYAVATSFYDSLCTLWDPST